MQYNGGEEWRMLCSRSSVSKRYVAGDKRPQYL